MSDELPSCAPRAPPRYPRGRRLRRSSPNLSRHRPRRAGRVPRSRCSSSARTSPARAASSATCSIRCADSQDAAPLRASSTCKPTSAAAGPRRTRAYHCSRRRKPRSPSRARRNSCLLGMTGHSDIRAVAALPCADLTPAGKATGLTTRPVGRAGLSPGREGARP